MKEDERKEEERNGIAAINGYKERTTEESGHHYAKAFTGAGGTDDVRGYSKWGKKTEKVTKSAERKGVETKEIKIRITARQK